MVKNLFIAGEGNNASNTIAGVTFVITLGVLYFVAKPADTYGYVTNIFTALIASGIVYMIIKLIRRKHNADNLMSDGQLSCPIVGRNPGIDSSKYTVTLKGRKVIDYNKLKKEDPALYAQILLDEDEANRNDPL